MNAKRSKTARALLIILLCCCMLTSLTVHAAGENGADSVIYAIAGETAVGHFTVNNTGNIILYKGTFDFSVNVPQAGTLTIGFTIPEGGSINSTNLWVRGEAGRSLVYDTTTGGEKSAEYTCKTAGVYTFQIETMYQPSVFVLKELDISVHLTADGSTGEGPGGNEDPDKNGKFGLVSTSPVCGNYEVDRHSSIELTFSKEIMACNANSVKLMKFYNADQITNWHDPEKPLFISEDDEEIPVSVKMYDRDKATVQIVPEKPLEKNTIYYVCIDPSGLISVAGDYYGGTGYAVGARPLYYFKTGDALDSVSFEKFTAQWDESLFEADPTALDYPGSQRWKQLAMLSGILSGLSYGGTADRILNTFEYVGLEDGKFFNEASELLQPGYAFAHKPIVCSGQKKELVVAVFRGTVPSYWEDVATDLTQIVGGINAAADAAYTKLMGYLAGHDIALDDAVFLVTGHSLGGGMAGCVAAKLNHNRNISPSHVFGFTFASPKISSVSDRAPGRNISNFVSASDVVVHVGLYAVASFHYGGIYYVRTPVSAPFKESHALTSYLNEVDTIEGTGVKPKWYEVVVQCPVDVEVYNSDGVLVGRITDNTVDADSTVPAYADGDDKHFFLEDGERYTVRLLATGTGTMTYTVLKADGAAEETVESKQWHNVALYDGKTMVSEIGDNISAIQLLTEDESGITGEIEQNGAEHSVNGGPGGATEWPEHGDDTQAGGPNRGGTGIWLAAAAILLAGTAAVVWFKKRARH